MELKFPKPSKKKKTRVGKFKYKSTDSIETIAVRNFQKYIRMRDTYNGGNCISCGKYIQWNDNCDAGHYISRRNKATLFDETNIHAQCKHCNRWLNGNLDEYRKRLIDKIGIEKVELLDSKKGQIVQRKRIHFIALNELYLKKCRDIKNGN